MREQGEGTGREGHAWDARAVLFCEAHRLHGCMGCVGCMEAHRDEHIPAGREIPHSLVGNNLRHLKDIKGRDQLECSDYQKQDPCLLKVNHSWSCDKCSIC